MIRLAWHAIRLAILVVAYLAASLMLAFGVSALLWHWRGRRR